MSDIRTFPMSMASWARRTAFGFVCVVAFVLPASALNPDLDISQYAHTAWRVRDGFTKGVILAIAQTPDGYLWLGTEFGLYRFDGAHAAPWQPSAGQELPSQNVYSLLVSRDGTLWIGTDGGAASWKDGRLTRYSELDGQTIHSFLEDREGTIWTAGEKNFSNANICAIAKGNIRCYGKDGSLGTDWIVSLYEDKKDVLWAVGRHGLWRWRSGPAKFYPLPFGPDNLHGLVEDSAGKLLVGIGGRIRQFAEGKIEPYPSPGNIQPFITRTLLRDHDGGLWIATYHVGLVHLHNGRADIFRQSDGLSNDEAVAIFEDRENNIWVSTNGGLDRFRETAVATFSVKEGLSNGVARSVLADKDGSVWIATPSGLDQWRNGHIQTYDHRDGGLHTLAAASLFQERNGRVWATTTRELGYLEGGRFVSVTSTNDGRMQDIVQDSAGDLWMAEQSGGLLHLRDGNLVDRIPWAALGHKDFALSLAADPVRGGIWLGFWGGGISYFANGHIQSMYKAADGLGAGSVASLQADKDGTLWAATDGGLNRIKNGRFSTISRKNGLPCDPIHWMKQDDDHSFWLYTPCSLLRISRSEMDAWTAAADRNQATKQMVHPTVFDNTDGVRVQEISYHAYNPPVTRSLNGDIWFVNADGVSMFDPRHLPFNRLPPPVHIEQVIVDAKNYEGLSGQRFPPLSHALTIGYTALSLTAPEKVRFRYRLEGEDSYWREAVNERQVQYTNLPPGHYVFHVIACNNDGVWNEAGAILDFSILPAYYQTTWFRLLCGAVFVLLLWGLYQLRLQQLRRQFAARLAERARIVEELHIIIDSIPGFVCAMSPEGGVEFLNRRLLEYFGKTFEEMRGGWATNGSIHPEERDQSFAMFKNSMKNGTPHEFEQRYRRADGVYRWFHRSACPVRDADGRITGWYALMTDIEDRKRVEDELQRNEAFLAEGQQLSSTGTFCWRLDTDEVVFSEEACRIFEFELTASVTLGQIGDRIHPDDIPLLSEKMNQARATGDKQDYEIRLKMAGGSVKYIHVSSHANTYQDGHLEYIGAIQDETERRLAEEAVSKLRSELAHMARVTSLGALTASIAHEVSQPLSGMMTNASTCLRMLGADPPNLLGALETTQRTIRDGKRASEVITRLRLLFSKKEAKVETIDLNEAAHEVLALCADELQRNRVKVQQELATDLPLVAGDRVQLQQVILNLLRNASDAMSGVADRPRELVIKTERDEDDCVRLSVRDTGVGITTQDMERLFNPFYTTKDDGMGIGLSVSSSIIERHNGRLWATPNDGPGASFSFSIPVGPQEIASSGKEHRN